MYWVFADKTLFSTGDYILVEQQTNIIIAAALMIFWT
jgi:hypothetical protein